MQHYKMKLKTWHSNTAYLLCKKVHSKTSYGKVYTGFEVINVFALHINNYLFKSIVTYFPSERSVGLIGLYYNEKELAEFDENEPVNIIL